MSECDLYRECIAPNTIIFVAVEKDGLAEYLKYLNIYLDTNLKIILSNNKKLLCRTHTLMTNAAQSFNVLLFSDRFKCPKLF